jgi:hypothetical protein
LRLISVLVMGGSGKSGLWPGDRAGLSVEHRSRLRQGVSLCRSLLEFCEPRMAPAPPKGRFIVSGLYLQWDTLRSHAFLFDRAGSISRVQQAGRTPKVRHGNKGQVLKKRIGK